MVEERCILCPYPQRASSVGRCEEQSGGGDARRLCELREEVELLKQSLVELVQEKKAMTAAMNRVVAERMRVSLRRRAYEECKQRLRAEYEEVQQVASSNQRRDDRLARVRGKDFSKRVQEMKRENGERRREVEERRESLQETRRDRIVALQTLVFPIYVEPLSQDDAGEDDYELSAVIDCDTAMDVDDGWVLGGVHRSPTPHASILSASLPLNGDYTPYIVATEDRRQRLKRASENGAPLPPVTAVGLHPLLQPYLAVPAGLQFTAQLVEVVADALDTPLPHPLSRPLCILEYGNQNKKKRSFVDSRAKLDDNILYLCFSQNVPLSALSPGHTLSNLLALVTHSELGRQGAFTCEPDLATYRGDGGQLTAGDPENEPPLLCTAAPLSPASGEDSDEEREGEGEEWTSVEVRVGKEGGTLQYQSGYLDFVSLGGSREQGAGGEEGRTVGLFATISSLFSSTLTSGTNTS